MDPLSALGLAGSVVQFVQFAASIVKGTKEVYSSASGVSSNHEDLEYIHGRLAVFCTKLEAGFGHDEEALTIDPDDESPLLLTDLASRCRQECRQLLTFIDSIRGKSSARLNFWRSFRAALQGVLKADEIKSLEERIATYQRQMLLLLCSVSGGAIKSINVQIQSLRSEGLTLHNNAVLRLKDISDELYNINLKIDTVRSRADKKDKEIYEEEYESLTTKVSELSLQSQKCVHEYELLSSLNYEQGPVRHDSIKNAHHKTFSWIYKDDGAKTEGTRCLISWLKEGSGIFWVSGRPGSGKSTFMKFITSRTETDDLLSIWANNVAVIKASHYFWSSGTELQRSQEGLLRSLLYDILWQNPALIPIACPERWSRIVSGSILHSLSWTMRDLQEAIHRISQQRELPTKFCFFVDGLDEFGGDRHELLKSLEELSECQDIKLLVSSRPWNDFVQRFSEKPMLHLHNLTHDDIRQFSESQLLEHQNWQDLVSQVGEAQALSLVEEISDRARGVFLWVFLVTRLLREGMTNYDTFFELQDRLRRVPVDLENFFKAMLDSVEPFYHAKMAGTLQLAITAREPLPVTVYSFHDLGYERPDYVIEEEVKMWSIEDEEKFQAPFSRRLAARCKELLEVQGSKVEFLHRTVRDFLRYAEMRNYLASKAPANFDPSFSIFQGFCAWTKHTNFLGMKIFDLHQKSLVSRLDHMLLYISENTSANIEHTYHVLDNLEESLEQLFDQWLERYDQDSNVHQRPSMLFRQRLLVADLVGYVIRRMEQDYFYLDDQVVSPLSVVLEMEGSTDPHERGWTNNRVKLLEYLLISGCSPNEGTATQSPWFSFLVTVLSEDSVWSGSLTTILKAGIIPLLLDHGADVDMSLNFKYRNGDLQLPIWAQFMSIIFLPNRLSIQAAAYVQVLERFLEGAEMETVDDVIDLNSWLILLKLSTVDIGCEQAKTTPQLAMFQIITSALQKMSRGPRHSHLEVQLIARVMEVFLKHATHPSGSLSELHRAIQSVFPSNLATRLLRALQNDSRGNEPAKGRKRALTNDSDQENSSRRPKATRTGSRTKD